MKKVPKEKEEMETIAFRAPKTLAEKVEMAEAATGSTKSYLMTKLVERKLSELVSELHEERMRAIEKFNLGSESVAGTALSGMQKKKLN